MKSDMIIVASNGNGLQEALLQTEKVAEQYHLSPKDTLHLRLLVEEMLNMMRSIILNAVKTRRTYCALRYRVYQRWWKTYCAGITGS